MKALSVFRKRSVLMIGALAIMTLSFVPLSLSHNPAPSLVVKSVHQSLAADTQSTASSNSPATSPTSTDSDVASPSVVSATDPVVTGDSTGSTSSSTGTASPITAPSNTAPSVTPTSTPPPTTNVNCLPCGSYPKTNQVSSGAILCPMTFCQFIPPTSLGNPPTTISPSCSPCGGGAEGDSTSPIACSMVCDD